MRNVGQFYKVSYEQFKEDANNKYFFNDNDIDIHDVYDSIKLPCRATKGSAGYDFFFPYDDFELGYKQTMIIPTGIKTQIVDEWFLGLFPKSSFGNNYRIKLDDTVSVIDGDYFNCSSNEGHIIVKMTNNDKYERTMTIKKGQSYCQGVFIEYGIIDGDNVTDIRSGGFGSTTEGGL